MQRRKIPAGAIKIALPFIRQPDDYSCGAGAAMSVAGGSNTGPSTIDAFKAAMGTNPQSGTYYREVARYLNELRFDATIRIGMTRRGLTNLIDKRIPVILSMQAWAKDPSVYQNADHQADGHYIVAIGYDDDDCFYFMDPSIDARPGYLSWKDLDRRWQENEGTEGIEFYRHLGIIVRPGKNTDKARCIRPRAGSYARRID